MRSEDTVVHIVYLVSVRMRTHSSIFNIYYVWGHRHGGVHSTQSILYYVSSYLILQAQYPRWPWWRSFQVHPHSPLLILLYYSIRQHNWPSEWRAPARHSELLTCFTSCWHALLAAEMLFTSEHVNHTRTLEWRAGRWALHISVVKQ